MTVGNIVVWRRLHVYHVRAQGLRHRNPDRKVEEDASARGTN
jgi:hypothetical protein